MYISLYWQWQSPWKTFAVHDLLEPRYNFYIIEFQFQLFVGYSLPNPKPGGCGGKVAICFRIANLIYIIRICVFLFKCTYHYNDNDSPHEGPLQSMICWKPAPGTSKEQTGTQLSPDIFQLIRKIHIVECEKLIFRFFHIYFILWKIAFYSAIYWTKQ